MTSLEPLRIHASGRTLSACFDNLTQDVTLHRHPTLDEGLNPGQGVGFNTFTELTRDGDGELLLTASVFIWPEGHPGLDIDDAFADYFPAADIIPDGDLAVRGTISDEAGARLVELTSEDVLSDDPTAPLSEVMSLLVEHAQLESLFFAEVAPSVGAAILSGSLLSDGSREVGRYFTSPKQVGFESCESLQVLHRSDPSSSDEYSVVYHSGDDSDLDPLHIGLSGIPFDDLSLILDGPFTGEDSIANAAKQAADTDSRGVTNVIDRSQMDAIVKRMQDEVDCELFDYPISDLDLRQAINCEGVFYTPAFDAEPAMAVGM